MTQRVEDQHSPGPQKVIVTAGGSGIGLAIAQRFQRAGAMVEVCDISTVALEAARVTLPGAGLHHADIADPDSVDRFMTAAIERLGGLDVIVNNAGIGGPAAALEDIEIGDWVRTIQTNLNGMFFCLRHAIPVMKAQRSGAIVNISTSSTRTGLPLRTPYVASKTGVEGLTTTLAREVGPWNIRCNAILPGMIDNERGQNLIRRQAEREGISFEDALKSQLRFIAMRTMIPMPDIGDMAVFLAGEGASRVTGQLIAVDGLVEWES